MKEFIETTIEELVGYPVDMQFKETFEKNGIDNQIITACMLCKKIDRLTDVLKGIDATLDNIDNSLDYLTKCIAYIPPMFHQKEGYYVFRIAGQIDTN